MTTTFQGTALRTPNASNHRFHKMIGGREYAIEVSPALGGRWRASLLRNAGIPTALMPFYGATPGEARDRLTGWLTAAYQVAAPVPAKKPA